MANHYTITLFTLWPEFPIHSIHTRQSHIRQPQCRLLVSHF